jgi:hypothetical protein
MKLIKEYDNFILFEHKEGFKECIHKQDLGMIPKIIKEGRKPIFFRTGRSFKNSVKPVLQYNLDGTFIKKWDSRKQASDELGIPRDYISKCCNGYKPYAGGYIWRNEEE